MNILNISSENISNGCIPLDSEFAKEVGFTSNKFEGYLWKDSDTIIISLIISKQEKKGNFLSLLSTIEDKGYNILVPTPSDRMFGICSRFGMNPAMVGEVYCMCYKNIQT